MSKKGYFPWESHPQFNNSVAIVVYDLRFLPQIKLILLRIMSDPPPLYVLIVGIDRWLNKDLPPLEGAVNDAKLIRQVLQTRFSVPDENILVILNEQATRNGIEHAFRTQLIDRAKHWKSRGSSDPSPAFVFYYAGHGSRTSDPTGVQPDGKDETIVPYDSRVGDVYDIKDWEIGGWLSELTQWTDNVTVIMDCCNSGSGTRDTEDIGTSRSCEPDLRPQPAKRPLIEAERPDIQSGSAASVTKSNHSVIKAGTRNADGDNLNRYVLLAACRSFEAAKEYTVKGKENQRTDVKRYKQGVFTWFLAKELMSLTPGQQATYQDVFERTRYLVHQKYHSQMPQCEGDRNRVLFGGARIASDRLVTVIEKDDSGVWIDAGEIHGVTKNAQLNVYPAKTRTLSDDLDPVATLTVVATEPVRSRCECDGAQPIDHLAKAAFIGSPSRLTAHQVVISISDPRLSTLVSERLKESDLATYVEISDEPESADFKITNRDHALTIRDSLGKPLVKSADESMLEETLDRIPKDLAAICRFRNVRKLENNDRNSALRSKISIEFHEVIDDDDYEEIEATEKNLGRRVRRIRPIEKTTDGLPICPIGQSVAIKITNHADRPLYCDAISFGWDFAIIPLTGAICDEGVRKRVEPGGSQWFGRNESESPLAFALPDDEQAARHFVEAHESLKVIATTDEPDFSILFQPGLSMPTDEDFSDEEFAEGTRSTPTELDELFDQAMRGTRALGAKKKKKKKHDWTTADCDYVVIRGRDEIGQAVQGGRKVELDQYDVSINSPPSFSCHVKVLSPTETMRSVGEDESEFPTGLIWDSESAQSLGVSARAETNDDGNALSITADSNAFESLSEQQPLNISIGGVDDDDRPLMAIAWDGKCATPIAVSNNSELSIPWLPTHPLRSHSPPSNDQQDDDEIETGTRGLVRTVKLYLYRLANLEAPQLGLHCVRFVSSDDKVDGSQKAGMRCETIPGGEIHYRKFGPGDISTGSRVALLIHGFSDHSKNVFADLRGIIKSQLDQYDCLLTFDYESFATPITENGKLLAQQMNDAGFSSDGQVNVDVFATGMGALIARSMIEQHGGTFVNRCFFAGPPNHGSVLMKAKKQIPVLGTLILNAAAPGPIANFLGAGIKKLESDSGALSDLVPDSEFLRALNEAEKPASVKYHVLAGDYDPSHAADGWFPTFAKIADVGLDLVFRDKHDLFTDTQSMTGLGGGQQVEVKRVGCHHFSYFRDPDAGQALADWLAIRQSDQVKSTASED